jgi:hypothetical protein
MADSDPINISTLGHRRWILNPLMAKTMFGMVYSAPDAKGSSIPFAAMYALNQDRGKAEVSYDYVAWPSAGWFPQEMFSARDAWSVSLNTDKYDRKRTNEIKVTLVRERDGHTWQFERQGYCRQLLQCRDERLRHPVFCYFPSGRYRRIQRE